MTESVSQEAIVEETTSNWGGLPVREMLDEGFTLYKRNVGERAYMKLRRGNDELSLGPFVQDKWDLFLKEYPNALPDKGKRKSSFLSTKFVRPKAIGSKYEPSTEVLDWFFWFQERGFKGKLDDFLNEIVSNYFVQQGLKLAVVIRES